MKRLSMILILISSAICWADNKALNLFTASEQIVENLELRPGQKITPTNNSIQGQCEMIVTGGVSTTLPCRGVQVILSKYSGGEVTRSGTNGEGYFEFSGLVPGRYNLQIQSEKFKLKTPLANLIPGNLYKISVQEIKN